MQLQWLIILFKLFYFEFSIPDCGSYQTFLKDRPTSAGWQMLVNVCLLLKSGHSEAVNDRQPTASLQNSALRIILIKE